MKYLYSPLNIFFMNYFSLSLTIIYFISSCFDRLLRRIGTVLNGNNVMFDCFIIMVSLVLLTNKLIITATYDYYYDISTWDMLSGVNQIFRVQFEYKRLTIVSSKILQFTSNHYPTQELIYEKTLTSGFTASETP